MNRSAKLLEFSLILSVLGGLWVALAGCGPAAAPANEPQPEPTRASVERPETISDAGFVSIPNEAVTPVPTPTAYVDNEPLEVAPGGRPGGDGSTTGLAKPASQPARPSGQPAVRGKKPVGGLTSVDTSPVSIPAQEGQPQQQAYTWEDGDRTLTVYLQADLTVEKPADVRFAADVVGKSSHGNIVKQTGSGAAAGDGSLPVFRSPSGTLMTLPGGVLLALDETWDDARVNAFFAGNGIASDRISELEYLDNGFFVETEPGFPSLQLANRLAAQNGVEVSSPNWWREVVAK